MREISVRNERNLGIFIAAQVLLLAAPYVGLSLHPFSLERHLKKSTYRLTTNPRPVYSLTNYMLLGRTLYYVPYLSMIHPGRVISTFVGLDGVVEALTGNGAAKIANFLQQPGAKEHWQWIDPGVAAAADRPVRSVH